MWHYFIQTYQSIYRFVPGTSMMFLSSDDGDGSAMRAIEIFRTSLQPHIEPFPFHGEIKSSISRTFIGGALEFTYPF